MDPGRMAGWIGGGAGRRRRRGWLVEIHTFANGLGEGEHRTTAIVSNIPTGAVVTMIFTMLTMLTMSVSWC